jgi:hypothetical protein
VGLALPDRHPLLHILNSITGETWKRNVEKLKELEMEFSVKEAAYKHRWPKAKAPPAVSAKPSEWSDEQRRQWQQWRDSQSPRLWSDERREQYYELYDERFGFQGKIRACKEAVSEGVEASREREMRPLREAYAELPRYKTLDPISQQWRTVMQPADEKDVRLLVGTMLTVMKAKADDEMTVKMRVDVFCMELVDAEFPAAAIAVAVREAWQTKTFTPSIAEFIELTKKHYGKLYKQRRKFVDFYETCYGVTGRRLSPSGII